MRADFPDASCKIDPPLYAETGHWYLDISNGGNTVFVEWRPKQGFGVSFDGEEGTDREIVYGEGPQ